MSHDQHRVKESPLKWISAWMVAAGLVCVAASICYAIREYDARSSEQVDAINAQTAVMKSQSMQKYREEKLAAYARATEAAAKIAALKSASAPAAQVQDAVTQFKTLLLGPAPITEGRDASTAMSLFNGALDADADAGQLQQLSLDLAHVCANEARDAFPTAGQAGPDYGANSAILAQMKEVARNPEAQHAAEQWLAQIDAEQYAESWKAAAESFQSTVAQDAWEHKIGSLRKLLGSVGSRKFRSADYTGPAPGAAEGEHIVLQFDTSFSERNNAVETLTAVPGKDGQWRVSAYSVR